MECAKCGEYFIGTCVSLKCYDILYNEKKELEQENAKLRYALETIIDGAGCCTGEDAVNMLKTAEYAIKSITRGEGE